MLDHETQHEHPHVHSSPEVRTSARLLAICVVAGAVIIAASILFAGRVIARKVSTLSLQASAPTTTVQQVQQQPAPTAPVVADVTERSDAPVLGNKNAKVTMIEFADFQCPFCKSFFQDTFGQIKSQYIDTGKIKYEFRHFPLSFHVNAQISAVAAECANQQGKFWQYHDLLYTDGQSDGSGLDKASLEKYADQLGLNKGTLGLGKNKFNQCLENNSTLKTVQADTTEGTKDGVSGTPTFYINGKQVVGAQPYAQFKQLLDAALSQ